MKASKRALYFTVAVAGLGYFVDIYDLLLFGIVRVPSLRALGVPDNQMLDVGLRLLNFQMAGMLIGGIIWGVIGDRRGRKSVLFGSIILYSVCNILNAFVPNPEVYAWLRFFAGVGLAGELGAAITLVAEVSPRESRGFGTSIVASIGILGAVLASLVGDAFNWQTAYIVGGVMGLGLLVLRAGLLESTMFNETVRKTVARGHFHKLFLNRATFGRYICCILIGVPIWYVIGILVTFAPELARELGVHGEVTGSRAILWTYIGGSTGDFGAGFLSQWLKSRKKTLLMFLPATLLLTILYVNLPPISSGLFYVMCLCLGLATGYWATFVTVGAEQFGTNIRATVATTVPNFVRGSVVPITLLFKLLRPEIGMLHAVLVLGVGTIGMAFAALYFLHETFTKDLDYLELH